MLIAETIRISLASIRSNLFRALLTMLGIIIGVGAVITMVALGTGAQRQIDDQMAALGGDILRIQASAWFSRGVARNQDTLTTDDALALMSGMEHVSAVVPEISSRFQAKFGNQNLNLQVIGTTPNYASVHISWAGRSRFGPLTSTSLGFWRPRVGAGGATPTTISGYHCRRRNSV
jgi:putative ABC transport system permease protein